MKNNKGFVMIETIIVITVLSVGLIMLYASYTLILGRLTIRSNFDSISHIYRVHFVNTFLMENGLSVPDVDRCFILAPNTLPHSGCVSISSSSVGTHRELYNIFRAFDIQAVHTKMNKTFDQAFARNDVNVYDGSTIAYVRSLRPQYLLDTQNRIVVKFVEEDFAGVEVPYFASLKFTIGGE